MKSRLAIGNLETPIIRIQESDAAHLWDVTKGRRWCPALPIKCQSFAYFTNGYSDVLTRNGLIPDGSTLAVIESPIVLEFQRRLHILGVYPMAIGVSFSRHGSAVLRHKHVRDILLGCPYIFTAYHGEPQALEIHSPNDDVIRTSVNENFVLDSFRDHLIDRTVGDSVWLITIGAKSQVPLDEKFSSQGRYYSEISADEYKQAVADACTYKISNLIHLSDD